MNNTVIFLCAKDNPQEKSPEKVMDDPQEKSLKEAMDEIFQASFNKNVMVGDYYPLVNEPDLETLRTLDLGVIHTFLAVIHDGKTPKTIYMGRAFRSSDTELYMQIAAVIMSDFTADYFQRAFRFSTGKDLCRKQLLSVETLPHFPELVRDLAFFPPYPKKRERKECRNNDFENPFAQKDEYCDRAYNFADPSPYRGEFQRDCDRIVQSKAFRRLVDKAQIFSASKGVHYRTRMTHTQAVVQIARSIGAGLKLHDHLVEAIALGHDIGHTPFGHQGERTLDDILNNKIEIIKDAEFLRNFGGFKHNYQSLRVLTILEDAYFQIPGLDLSYQTLEGIWKHTSLKRNICARKDICEASDECVSKDKCVLPEKCILGDNCTLENNCVSENLCILKDKYHLHEFVDTVGSSTYIKELMPEYDFPTTLEGQVVAIADEIAQRAHDVDDALNSGHLTFEELKEYAETKKHGRLKKVFDELDEEMITYEDYYFGGSSEVKNARVVSKIISYFVNDIIETTQDKINNMQDEVDTFIKDGHRIKKKIIWFSATAAPLNTYLENIVKDRVVKSTDVAMFDTNAANVVIKLFEAYYNNPLLLPSNVKQRIISESRRFGCFPINWEKGDSDTVRQELWWITKSDIAVVENDDVVFVQIESYINKRKILVRAICDYIADMTDSFALNEYNRLL